MKIRDAAVFISCIGIVISAGGCQAEDPRYTYTMLPYGDYAIGRAEDPLLDELENSFDEQVADIRESASDLTYLEWRSAGDMLEE